MRNIFKYYVFLTMNYHINKNYVTSTCINNEIGVHRLEYPNINVWVIRENTELEQQNNIQKIMRL